MRELDGSAVDGGEPEDDVGDSSAAARPGLLRDTIDRDPVVRLGGNFSETSGINMYVIVPYNSTEDAMPRVEVFMNRTKATGKPKRIEARVTEHEKELVERAAAISGRSITDFVVSSALEKAEETIRSHQILTLSTRDSEAFADAILNSPAPTEKQRAAARRYRAFIGE